MGVLILIVIFFLPGGMLGFAAEKLKERRENRNNRANRK
jgi:hypothetical protein